MMFGLSTVKLALLGGVSLLLLGLFTYMGFAMHNRALEISELTADLAASGKTIEQTVKVANDNAEKAKELGNWLAATEQALADRAEKTVKLAADIAKLQTEVTHAKAASCYPPAILSMVVGLRELQTGSADTPKDGNAAREGAKGASSAPAASYSSADQAVARWIGDLYRHDSLCMENLAAIGRLQGD